MGEPAVPPSVEVQPATREQLHALIDGPSAFLQHFGQTVADGYNEFPGVLEHALGEIPEGEESARWGTHLFFDRDDEALIGIGGFKGPPEGGDIPGEVEIGYAIAPAYRGRGCATAAARRLIDLAHEGGVTLVSAHTLGEPNASTRVLQRLGFTRTAEIVDPEEGTIWRWELGGPPTT